MLVTYRSFAIASDLAAQESYLFNLAGAALCDPENREAVAELLADYAGGECSLDEAAAELETLVGEAQARDA